MNKIAYIEWIDSQNYTCSWMQDADISEKLPLMRSIGFIHRDNEEELILIGCCDEDWWEDNKNKDAMFSRTIRIPKCQIRLIK